MEYGYYRARRFDPCTAYLLLLSNYQHTHTHTPKPVQRFITQFFSFSYYNEIETIFLYYYFSRLLSTRKLRWKSSRVHRVWNNGDNNKYYEKWERFFCSGSIMHDAFTRQWENSFVGETNGFECQGDLYDDWHNNLRALHEFNAEYRPILTNVAWKCLMLTSSCSLGQPIGAQ